MSGRLPQKRRRRPHSGAFDHRARGGEDPRAPSEPEFRPAAAEPLPEASIEEQFREMFAVDDEAIEWRRAEERASWAVRR